MIYATFQIVEARVDISYVGTAINGDCQSSIFERPLKGIIRHGIIAAGYVIPFVMVLIITIMLIILMYKEIWTLLKWMSWKVRSFTHRYGAVPNAPDEVQNAPMSSWREKLHSKAKKFLTMVKNDVEFQGDLVATTLVCSFATFYIFALDMHSIYIESRGNLPGFFSPKQGYFFNITWACSAITLVPWIFGIFCLIFSPSKFIHVPMILCISSTVLALSFHFQTILIAWTITPFYAGRILLYYGVIIFVYFLSLKYTYILSVELCDGEKYRVVFSLLFTTVVVSGVVATVAIFVVYVPTINSIEEFAVGITTIYHSAILLIGGLIAYNLGGHYLSGSFSMNTVLKSEMKKIDHTGKPYQRRHE